MSQRSHRVSGSDIARIPYSIHKAGLSFYVSTGGNNKVTADVLRVRTAPNTSSSVSGRVYAGQTLNLLVHYG